MVRLSLIELASIIGGRFFLLVAALIGLCSCATVSTQAPPKLSSEMREELTGGEAKYNVVRVFYGTDRAPLAGNSPKGVAYGYARSDETNLGYCDVSIPPDHREGTIESPSWFQTWILRQKEDPNKDVVVLQTTLLPKDQFLAQTRELLAKDSGAVLIFVHGFNVSFEEAAQRTAQMTYDLKFKGLPLMWSWPSRHVLSARAYNADGDMATWTTPHFEEFLKMIKTQLAPDNTTIVTHSMGNRVVGGAFDLADREKAFKSGAFRAIILTAPDVDAQTFADQMIPAVRSVANDVTVYVSSKDRALGLSSFYHDDIKRPSIKTVMDGVDVIDATLIDTGFIGHFYYEDNISVISDIKEIMDGEAVTDREHLKRLSEPPTSYWEFLP